MQESLPVLSSENFLFQDSNSLSLDNSLEEASSEILILSIDLGDGRKKSLTVHENEDPEILAIEFCQQNHLGPRVKIAICDEIARQLILPASPVCLESPTNVRSSPAKAKEKKINIGHELYMKGIRMKEKLEQSNQRIRETFLAKEMKDATFSPETNSPKRRSTRPEIMLIEKGKQIREKIQKKRSEKEIHLMNECTFSPEIDKNSIKMQAIELKATDRFQALYQDAENFREKLIQKSKKLITQNCPFVPNLNLTKKKTKEFIRKPEKPVEMYRDTPFSLSPQVILIKKSSPVKIRYDKTPGIIANKSEKIIRKVKKARFQALFSGLLPDHNGFISKETVYKSELPYSTLLILKPLLKELEELDETLNLDEFCQAMEMLMKLISPSEKSQLLQTAKAKPKAEVYDFKPRINLRRSPTSPKRSLTPLSNISIPAL